MDRSSGELLKPLPYVDGKPLCRDPLYKVGVLGEICYDGDLSETQEPEVKVGQGRDEQKQQQPKPLAGKLKIITINVEPQSIVCIRYPLGTDMVCNQNAEDPKTTFTFNNLSIPNNQHFEACSYAIYDVNDIRCIQGINLPTPRSEIVNMSLATGSTEPQNEEEGESITEDNSNDNGSGSDSDNGDGDRDDNSSSLPPEENLLPAELIEEEGNDDNGDE